MRLAKIVPLAAVSLCLAFDLGCRAHNGAETESPRVAAQPLAQTLPCSGSQPASSGGKTSAQGDSHPHSVTLSWNAATPGSKSPGDAIKGYYVYRSSKSHSYTEKNRISVALLPDTRCVDSTVEPGKVYFYTVKAISRSGQPSPLSAEVKAVVPSP